MNFSFENLLSAFLKRIIRQPIPEMIMLGLALTIAGWGMSETIRGFPTSAAAWASIFGAPMAWWAASRPRRRSITAILLFSGGIFLLFLQAGDMVGALWASVAGLMKLIFSIAQNFIVQIFWEGLPPPNIIEIPPEWFSLSSGLALVWGRFSNWLGLFLEGRPFYDQAAVMIWWGAAAWIFAWWGGGVLRLKQSALLAIAPSGALMLALVNRSGGDPRLVLPFTGAALALLASSHYFTARRRWETRRLDLPDTLGLDSAVWSGTMLGMIVILGLATTALPALNVETLREITASMRPAGESGGQASDALGVQPANRLPTPPTRVGGASLPRQHLVGAGPELSEQLALYAKILGDSNPAAELNPGEAYYLRGLVYDVYLRTGWASSAFTTRQFEPGEVIQQQDPAAPNPRQIEQLITLASKQPGMVLTAGEVVAVNESVEATWRAAPSGSTDIFGLGIAEKEYQAWSSQSQASAADLRQTSSDYPDWIRQRYLQLPDGIPPRVITLAATFAHVPTAYDTATAIESYLRTYTYTLDIPQPPIGKDVVEYFLFDLKQGYCDYFASAMVVLARLNGLPARLVIGYVASEFDPTNLRYVVKEKSAHSWVEIYFSSYGWIPFEPTAGLNSIQRPDSSSTGPYFPMPSASPPDWLRKSRASWSDWVLLVGALAFLVLLIAIQVTPIVDRWWVGKESIPLAITRLYRRYEELSVRLIGPQQIGRTPFETNTAVEAYFSGLGWPFRKAGASLQAAAKELTALYVLAAYAPHLRTPADLQHAWLLWGRFKRNARWLRWFAFWKKRSR